MSYTAAAERYNTNMNYRRSGRSGIDLPAISLGLWQNFGGVDVFETGRAILHRAFDLGVTHFDLANNYGPPFGSAEENFGLVMARDFAPYRDEMIISTKAGWDMWPGPYGGIGGSRKYLIASLDQSLKRMGLDYVDIFYSHRVDATTPLEETMGALAHLHRQGKALYIGISSYSPELTRKAAAILREERVPLFIHQPNYSMFNRWIEGDLLNTLEELGTGCIAFSPLAQGLLTSKYLNGIPQDTRATKGRMFDGSFLTEDLLGRIKSLNMIAERRGQSLAQMAIAWTLRDKRVSSSLIGARTVAQLENSLGALDNLAFSSEELAEIDLYATNSDTDYWKDSTSL
ncbi:L-glyceraldehyde 3-phosphate reductase [Cohaesibacter celericrescens]|uniref:Aldo/keto reductase n=1 Tax=Cohaesibacter celericrescens TaxID=2067669 RepID=A0A2N5XK84_9HYPH|nr:L-glyceraldehyde 3-phosphate reductase [Cohaesibacter celericrescens]PLW74837.1 aldo/keto reductase [Cohaesibacter celericrescens]